MPPKTIPSQFNAVQPAIASYSYTDIAEGTGIVKYFAAYCTNDKILTTQQINGYVWEEEYTVDSDSYSEEANYDFDVEFNKPQTIKGKGILSIPYGVIFTGTARAGSIKFDYDIIRYDGTTENSIVSGSQSFGATTGGGGTGINVGTFVEIIDIPKTHFKKGETLRLKIIVSSEADTGDENNGTVYWAFSPTDEAWSPGGESTDTSQLVFYVPFDIDL